MDPAQLFSAGKVSPPQKRVRPTDVEALWGEDAEAVEAAIAALFGQHPERGGSERAQAAYAVVQAVKPIILAQATDSVEPA